uniref:Uncharacterized protein n=1 Tax=Opuntia streptacantha TaxID=393608 RepID=A0A7C9AKY3_OPUST
MYTRQLCSNAEAFKGQVGQSKDIISVINQNSSIPTEKESTVKAVIVSTVAEKTCLLWPRVIITSIFRWLSPSQMSSNFSCPSQALHQILVVALEFTNAWIFPTLLFRIGRVA